MDKYRNQMDLIIERSNLISLIECCEKLLNNISDYKISLNIVKNDGLIIMNPKLFINDDIKDTLILLYKKEIKYANERILQIENILN